MKSIKQKALISLAAGLLISMFSVNVFAADKSTVGDLEQISDINLNVVKTMEQFDSSDTLNHIGEVKYSEALKLGTSECNLYPTFVNPNEAIRNVTDSCNELLADMDKRYHLGAFGANTVAKYIDMYEFYDQEIFEEHNNQEMEGAQYEKLEDQIDIFSEFEDIYSNYELNDEIEKMVSRIKTLTKSDTVTKIELTEKLEELSLALPYNTGGQEKVEVINNNLLSQNTSAVTTAPYKGNSKFNVSKGVTYATRYATTCNVMKYSTCRKDCTNFASQIKFEGGVPKYKVYGESGAWNYRIISNTAYPTLKYSVKWCNADEFCKFFGVKSKFSATNIKNKYTRFVKFAASVKQGSFIAFDKTGDGTWNHVGFVTKRTPTTTDKKAHEYETYHGTKYRNFRVAQHTKNYNKWVSDDYNSWETLPDKNKNVIYGIIN